MWHDYFMPSVTLEGSGDKSENYWKKYFWDTGTSVPFEKIDKKKLGKIPNSKIVTMRHNYFMPSVTLEGSGVRSVIYWKKYFWDTVTSVPFEKIKKKVGKNSQFKNCDTVTRLFYARCHIERVQCHIWKWLKKIFLGHWDQCPIRKITKKTLVKSLLTGNIRVVG